MASPVQLTPAEAEYVRGLILCTNHGVASAIETVILAKLDRCLDPQLSRLDELHRLMIVAGDRRDGDECDRIEAEIEKLREAIGR